MDTIPLRADCAQCDALCCVALAFDHSAQFAFDKPAGEPCRNLTVCGQCRIHDDLASRGFSGCVRFDCLGAGQRATQMFDRSWRDDPQTARAMFDAFHTLRRVHDLVLLLQEARKLPLSPDQRSHRTDLLCKLWDAGAARESLAASGRLAAEARNFLAGLRAHATQRSHSRA